MTEFCRGGSLEVLVVNRILDNLTLRVLVGLEEIGKCDSGWCGLLLLLLLVALSLLLGLAFLSQNVINRVKRICLTGFGFHVTSNIVAFFPIVAIFVLPFEHARNKSSCCCWLGRIDIGNCTAGRRS
jgi:hypothetical protein